MTQHENETDVLRPLKTWSHLAAARRRPSEYEIVSVKTLYNAVNLERPLELDSNVYMNRWLRDYRIDSPLKHPDWSGFRDPDELIYRTYTTLQNGHETYVDGLLDQHDEQDHDQGLGADWIETLATLYTPMRYLLHTLQMCSAYLVVVAPSSTIDNCAALQAADQYRWVSRVAYRTAELARHRPEGGFGHAERGHWENHPAWQGARELMEKLLIAYDWGEAFVGLNFVAKPAIDEGVLRPLAGAARRHGDTLLAFLIEAQLRDSERSRRWSSALVRYALAGDPANAAVILTWIEKWTPLATAATEAYCRALPDMPVAASEADEAVKAFHSSLGLHAIRTANRASP
ncbi:MAG: toluene monooxygenase [Gammaproteobacteria bacterium]|nr:toluene monooxygenase [Gammaproteobacteria bacterium]